MPLAAGQHAPEQPLAYHQACPLCASLAGCFQNLMWYCVAMEADPEAVQATWGPPRGEFLLWALRDAPDVDELAAKVGGWLLSAKRGQQPDALLGAQVQRLSVEAAMSAMQDLAEEGFRYEVTGPSLEATRASEILCHEGAAGCARELRQQPAGEALAAAPQQAMGCNGSSHAEAPAQPHAPAQQKPARRDPAATARHPS
ncbi:unnamed protein product [Prorocentrum cordatum]|uniref:Uncharacterized protein n=1 Tax=Prorocentrum cordatum TaxID=2364126 RepID=A0ABN9P837_9DINO|nr:unnamed protein product [Polarella glacialis]